MKKANRFILLPLVLLVLLVGNGAVCSLPYRNIASDVSGQKSPVASAISQNTELPGTLLPFPNATLLPGSTVQHFVAVGEWLVQIARCYGADLAAVRKANPEISDYDSNNNLIPKAVVIVPNIGSVGRIYGPPCVTFLTVQSGDTWSSIAQRYNADVTALQKVNPVKLSAGEVIKVPLNSADPVAFTFQEGPLQDRATLLPKERLKYQFRATKGERLDIGLEDAANSIALEVSGPTGTIANVQNLTQTWRVPIPASGTYLITVVNVLGATEETYKLLVELFAGASTPIASSATAEAGETLEQRMAKNTKAIDTFTMASIAYNVPPATMQLGETLTMELLLNPSAKSAVLASQINENGPLQTATIQVTDQVKAELIQEDDGFTIKPFRDSPEQRIGEIENTKWTWYVTAKTSGKHKLTLIIHRLILVDEEKDWIEAGTAYKSEINVTIPPGERFFRLDWKWIATTLLIPLFLWARKWFHDRKKTPSTTPTKRYRS